MTPLTGILTEQRRAGWTAGTADRPKRAGHPRGGGAGKKGCEL
ncbi:MAG: hypothetical protein ACLUOI_13345 [Eisenbergiella sp.]